MIGQEDWRGLLKKQLYRTSVSLYLCTSLVLLCCSTSDLQPSCQPWTFSFHIKRNIWTVVPFAIFPLQSWLEWIEPTDREIEFHNLQSLTSGVSFSFVHSWVDKEDQNRIDIAWLIQPSQLMSLLINLWLSFGNSYTLSPHIRPGCLWKNVNFTGY